MQAGRHKDYALDEATRAVPRQWWEGGIYENEFSRKSVNDPWQIQVLDYHPIWHADFDSGWGHTKPNYVPQLSVCYPEDPAGPDALLSDEERFLWRKSMFACAQA